MRNDTPAPVTDDDPSERVRVVVTSGAMAGETLAFWQACSISRSLSECSSSASVAVGRGKLTEAGFERFPLALGDGVQVIIGEKPVETPVLIGWVSKRNTTRKPDEHGLNIQIRSVTCDLVDCSAMNSPGQWVRAKLSRIAADLVKPFGIPVKVPAEFDRLVDNFEIEQGETVFDALERLGHANGLITHDTASGVLVMTRPGLTPSVTALLHLNGRDGGPDPRNNVLETDGEQDESKRFSHYVVKGQSEGGRKAAAASGSALDKGVARYRPKIVNPPGKADSADCAALAQWEAVRRAGQGKRLVHGVRGWRQTKGGPLWDIDVLAPVQDDDAEVYGKRLISAVSWTMNDKGRLAVVTLEPPEAWAPKPFFDKHGDGKGDQWASVRRQVNS